MDKVYYGEAQNAMLHVTLVKRAKTAGVRERERERERDKGARVERV